MWKFSGCPKCERDVFIYQTVNGMCHERCFSCGHRAELGSIVETEEMLNEAGFGQAEGGIPVKE